jgi:hypothetical protein
MRNRRVLAMILFFLVLAGLTAAAFFLEDRTPAPPGENEFLARQKVDRSRVTRILFSEDGIAVEGGGTAIDRKTVLILSGGTYELSGKSSDARVLVMCRKQKVTLILNGLDLSYRAGSPLFVYKSPLTVLELAEGTENRLSDPASYDYSDSYSSGRKSEPCSVIYSRKDLVIQGKGSLTLAGNYRDGIACLDSVGIFDCRLFISAPECGIRAGGTVCGESCRLEINCGQVSVLTADDPDGTRIRFTDCE